MHRHTSALLSYYATNITISSHFITSLSLTLTQKHGGKLRRKGVTEWDNDHISHADTLVSLLLHPQNDIEVSQIE